MRSLANARKPLRTDGRTDMPWNGHGWSGGPTDPCTGQKRVFQASDGQTDGQPENIMPPAPKGGGIKTGDDDISHLVYMPIGQMVLKMYVPCKNFHMPCQYLCKPCQADVYWWENKHVFRLKNHLPCLACNHKSLWALGQNRQAPGK